MRPHMSAHYPLCHNLPGSHIDSMQEFGSHGTWYTGESWQMLLNLPHGKSNGKAFHLMQRFTSSGSPIFFLYVLFRQSNNNCWMTVVCIYALCIHVCMYVHGRIPFHFIHLLVSLWAVFFLSHRLLNEVKWNEMKWKRKKKIRFTLLCFWKCGIT